MVFEEFGHEKSWCLVIEDDLLALWFSVQLSSELFNNTSTPPKISFNIPDLPIVSIQTSNRGPILRLISIFDLLLGSHSQNSTRFAMLAHLQHLLIEQTSSRLGMPRSWTALPEKLFDLFKCFPCRLGICEVSLDGGAEAERSEDDEQFPGDVGEGWWDEETDCEVEEPIA